MFDKIEKKVHEIRKQPEHIRIRYVWGLVGAAMLIVIFIWIISMKISFLNINNNPQTQESINDLQKRMSDITAESPITPNNSISIDELLENGSSK